MRALVTGSAGHLGAGLVLTLRGRGIDVSGIDIDDSDTTDFVGSITDSRLVNKALEGVDTVFHTATLHKPHIVTHSKQQFIDTNVSGTLCLLEAAINSNIKAFVFTSTTSVFGDALRPPAGSPAAWIDEEVVPLPKNIYGVTKLAAENLCRLAHREASLNTVALRTSRFFPEEDDDGAKRQRYSDANIKTLEFLYRRVELADVVDAHLKAAEAAPRLQFAPYIISATTPFRKSDLAALNEDAESVIRTRIPSLLSKFTDLEWEIFPQIERVYINNKARQDLGWLPKYNIDVILDELGSEILPKSPLSLQVGSKGYHKEVFDDGPYPV